MGFIQFIANRFSKKPKDEALISGPMMRIASIGIVLGMAVMIIAIAIVTGFKIEIREKVTGFSSHIQLLNRDMNKSYEHKPVDNNWSYIEEIKEYEGVKNVFPFITKPGVIKKGDEIEAVVLKGVDSTYDWTFFRSYITSGKSLNLHSTSKNNGIVLSEYTASRLNLTVGDKVNMFFMQKPIRLRKFELKGIYKTNLKTYDELYGIVDLRHLQKLNGWDNNQYSGYEVPIEDFSKIEDITITISDRIALDFNENDESLQAISTLEMAPQIYDWLQLQNMNVWVILILITLVAGINMITGLLINILEKTNQIGLFKAMGASNKQVISIFLISASRVVGKGMIIGNVIGLSLCYIQNSFGIISLDPDSYYLTEVPINFDWIFFAALNAGAFIVNIAMLTIPGFLIARINPAKTIRFD
jgi:lipoprotein-releasing system permease protein